MKKALILHGTAGSSDDNWFRWLEAELKSRDYEVWLPELPDADKPSLREWADYIQQNLPFELDEQALLIGHSSGAILALILAQESTQPIGGAVAISVFHDNSLQWDANNRLFDIEFNFEAIKKNAPQLLFIHSNDDPYVPLDQAKFVAKGCGRQTEVLSGQGHFNLEKSNDYATFPKLIELLEKDGLL